MTAPIRIVSPRIKRIQKPLTDRPMNGHSHSVRKPILFIDNSDKELEKEEQSLHSRKQDYFQKFKGWNMPEMPTGYLRASYNDLL